VTTQTDLGPDDITDFQKNMDFTKFGIDPNFGFFLMILIFFFAMGALYAAVKIHGKNFIRLITPFSSVRWQRVFFGLVVWAFLIILAEAVTYYMNPSAYTFSFSFYRFIPLLLIALFLLPVQTSFEEIFFRGYIMQGLGFWSNSKLVAILISSVLFSLMHGMNPEVSEFGFWTMMFYYISAGLFLALITVMDDGLELALGVHAATNMLGATLVTYSGSVLQTDALFEAKEIKPWLMILFFYISAVVFYLICSRRYGWKSITTIWKPIRYSDEKIDIA
jgi:membrane protease YdiL (CAAX protease family)